VIIEIKAVQKITPPDRLQIISYLRATTFEIGLLFHFGPTPAFERFIDHPNRMMPPGMLASTRA
jgi:GxxExxY protein